MNRTIVFITFQNFLPRFFQANIVIARNTIDTYNLPIILQKRFRQMEKVSKSKNKLMKAMSLDDLETIWNIAKKDVG